MRQGVYVTKIEGEVSIILNGQTNLVAKEKKIGADVSCELTTGKASYAYVTENKAPASKKSVFLAVLYPESKAVVHTGRGFIRKFEILEGLANVSLSKIVVPFAEFKGEEHERGWVEVIPGAKTIFADMRCTICNCNSGKAVVLDANQQVWFTENEIGEPEPMDQRFYIARKIFFNLGTFSGAEIYQSIMNQSDALLAATLEIERHIAEKTGQDFNKLRKETIEEHQRYIEWAKSESEELLREQERIGITDFNRTSTLVPIDQTVKYQNIDCKVISVKREAKSEETDLLSVKMEAENDSQKQIFVFWHEECRLINEQGEIFPVDDYNLETNYMPGSRKEGYLFVPINRNDKKFTLQFGKASLPKVEMQLDLSKSREGGD